MQPQKKTQKTNTVTVAIGSLIIGIVLTVVSFFVREKDIGGLFTSVFGFGGGALLLGLLFYSFDEKTTGRILMLGAVLHIFFWFLLLFGLSN